MRSQLRVSKHTACDYGDPQARPRILIVAAQPPAAPLPPPLVKTHGTRDSPYITVRETLQRFRDLSEAQTGNFPNVLGGLSTKTADRLPADTPAQTVRCTVKIVASGSGGSSASVFPRYLRALWDVSGAIQAGRKRRACQTSPCCCEIY